MTRAPLDDTLPGAGELAERAREVLGAHWQPQGYTAPNLARYPHQYLWDSCFHAIVWAHLGEADRALAELRAVFAHQADDGFVPHLTYWSDPGRDAAFWGREHTSCITQPPMYGHALAELVRLGIDVGDDLVEQAQRGLAFLLATRSHPLSGVSIVHPWESGCDDSPRWGAWCPGGFTDAAWYQRKGELVRDVQLSKGGTPIGNRSFEVDAAGFNALVAFNAAELASVVGSGQWARDCDRLAAVLAARWNRGRRTFADVPETAGATVRTADALLPVLVRQPRSAVRLAFRELRDPRAFGGACGPAGVHRAEASFDPARYWRGPSWPQLTYLFWVAAKRLGRDDDARWLRDAAVRGATRSGFAEYWHPDSGEGYGAIPQSWATLVAVMAKG